MVTSVDYTDMVIPFGARRDIRPLVATVLNATNDVTWDVGKHAKYRNYDVTTGGQR